MGEFFERIHEKSELTFALVWIGLYCLLNALGRPLSAIIGVEDSATMVINGLLSLVLFLWIRKSGRMQYYGLCKSTVKSVRFGWYLPLVLFASANLWMGVTWCTPLPDTLCYVLSMLCVGFLEEVIFRGFLFKALAKDSVKVAVVVSSVTFGIGHILNLFNGSGMDLLENLCQVMGAIACGFLFVTIFHRGGSLIPCIIAHGVNNAVYVFADQSAMTDGKQLLLCTAILAIVTIYALIIQKTVPIKK